MGTGHASHKYNISAEANLNGILLLRATPISPRIITINGLQIHAGLRLATEVNVYRIALPWLHKKSTVHFMNEVLKDRVFSQISWIIRSLDGLPISILLIIHLGHQIFSLKIYPCIKIIIY